jgi:hypothetical protein
MINLDKFWSKIDKSGPCWEWTGRLSRTGYGNFDVDQKPTYVHRISFELANGPITNGLHVLHQCDNRKCVNPSHLFLGTQQDNMKDMNAKGRHKFGRHLGTKNPSARLTEQQVLEIRSLKESRHALAAKYQVAVCTIDDIKSRKTWKHI